MAVTINLSDTFTIDRSAAQTLNSDITLVTGTIYVTGVGDATDYSVTLPATSGVAEGSFIYIKRLGTGEISIAANAPATELIDGVNQTIEINNNQPVRLIWHAPLSSWIIA